MTNNRASVRYATYRNEDTGEATPLFLYSHSQIDAEIDQRIRGDANTGCTRRREHEATRAKLHAALAASETMPRMAATEGVSG